MRIKLSYKFFIAFLLTSVISVVLMIATMQPEPSLIKCTRQSDKRHSLVVLKIQIPEALINVLFFCAFPPIRLFFLRR
jgi:hypothetical protein